jgi:hypothetical protein
VPLPDEIICNGKFSYQILIKNGFHKKLLNIGPALRYDYLFTNQTSKICRKKWDVFCPLPLAILESLEILNFLIAFLDKNNVSICIKPHPLHSLEYFYKYFGQENLKVKFKTNISFETNLNLYDILKKSKIVVGVGSSVLLEAACLKMPVITRSRKASLNLNPLEYFPKVNHTTFSDQEFSDKINHALSQYKTPQIFPEYDEDLRDFCFNRVTSQSMIKFL